MLQTKVDYLIFHLPQHSEYHVLLLLFVFSRFDPFLTFVLIVALLFFLFRLLKVIYNFFQYWEMRTFYTQAVKITSVRILSTFQTALIISCFSVETQTEVKP